MKLGEPFEIDWQVVAVFDPDGTVGDFAYTVGLADRGLSEIHVWARPSDGTDPGADFKLSQRDMCYLLNKASFDQIDGSLHPGSKFTIEFDDGRAEGHFRAGLPVDRESLEAFQAKPHSRVMPLNWELRRPAEGNPTEVDAHTAAQIVADTTRLRELAGLSGPVDTSANQHLGPRTPVVEALSAALRADPEHFVYQVEEHGHLIRDNLNYTSAEIRSAARTSGRRLLWEHCQDLAATDAAVIVADGIDLEDMGDIDPDEYRQAILRGTTAALTNSYAAAATQDLIDPSTASRALLVANAVVGGFD